MGTALSLALGGDLFKHKWGSIAHSLSLSPTSCPDMTENTVEKDVKSNRSIHPLHKVVTRATNRNKPLNDISHADGWISK